MSKLIMTNRGKEERALDVYDLMVGNRVPASKNEADRAALYARVCSEGKIDIKKKEDTVLFIYEKLGGLVRTEEEEKKAQAKKKQMKVDAKKKKIA